MPKKNLHLVNSNGWGPGSRLRAPGGFQRQNSRVLCIFKSFEERSDSDLITLRT